MTTPITNKYLKQVDSNVEEQTQLLKKFSYQSLSESKIFSLVRKCYALGGEQGKAKALHYESRFTTWETFCRERSQAQGPNYLKFLALSNKCKDLADAFSSLAKKRITESSYREMDTAHSEICISLHVQAAERGDVKSQLALGGIYRRGLIVERNDTVALQWFEKAAEGESPKAQNRLGMFYYRPGKYQNLKLAFDLMLKAANKGYSKAEWNIATMYARGEGVEKNKKLAYKYVAKAAKQGHKCALECLPEIIMKLKVKINAMKARNQPYDELKGKLKVLLSELS